MEQKNNKILWYIAALVLLLCVGTLIVSTGSSFARYRKSKDFTLQYEVKPREQVYMGTLSSDGNFTLSEENFEWKETGTDGSKRLAIAVANAESSAAAFPEEDREIALKLIGSAGFYDAEPKLILTDEDGEEKEVPATKKIIEKDTALYFSVGEGVIFEFFDENGEEIFWNLEGKKFSVQQIIIEADFSKVKDSAVIQPQITVK